MLVSPSSALLTATDSAALSVWSSLVPSEAFFTVWSLSSAARMRSLLAASKSAGATTSAETIFLSATVMRTMTFLFASRP